MSGIGLAEKGTFIPLSIARSGYLQGKVKVMRIGYARISTIEQSLNLQRDALEAAGCDVVYQDEGISGAKRHRPGLDSALHNLQSGDELVVWKLDRLGRSMRHLIELTEWMEQEGIGFRSLSDCIDTSTSGGRLYFHLMGAFAEFERNLISERTKAGMAAARARGAQIGRPKKKRREGLKGNEHSDKNPYRN